MASLLEKKLLVKKSKIEPHNHNNSNPMDENAPNPLANKTTVPTARTGHILQPHNEKSTLRDRPQRIGSSGHLSACSSSSSSSSTSSSSSSSRRVSVILRIRPLLPHETERLARTNGSEACYIEKDENDSASVCLVQPNASVFKSGEIEVLNYKFDQCFDSSVTQEEVFDQTIKAHLENIWKGLNTTVFAYGMTGAGKTFTMQGNKSNPGIIPRSIEHLIKMMRKKQVELHGQKTITMTVSFLELYNEKVKDLLQPSDEDLPIRQDANSNIFIPNLTEVEIHSLDNFQSCYARGCKNRTVASTGMNDVSSRSHAIISVKIEQKPASGKGKVIFGKLHMIDLAGSEDNRRTQNQGIRLTESSSINQSLFVLNQVVHALQSQNSGKQATVRIPYRDSKLTRLLQDSLGGNSISIMFANVAPMPDYFHDTYNTLNFASRSKMIVNRPVVNEKKEEAPKVSSLVNSLLRPKQVFDDSILSRLENLEKQLTVGDKKIPQTPTTKTIENLKRAGELVKEGRAYEEEKNYLVALQYFEQAYKLHQSEKLQLRINTMREKIDQEEQKFIEASDSESEDDDEEYEPSPLPNKPKRQAAARSAPSARRKLHMPVEQNEGPPEKKEKIPRKRTSANSSSTAVVEEAVVDPQNLPPLLTIIQEAISEIDPEKCHSLTLARHIRKKYPTAVSSNNVIYDTLNRNSCFVKENRNKKNYWSWRGLLKGDHIDL